MISNHQALLAALFSVLPATASSQDTLRLAELQDAALARDARAGQASYLKSASALRLTSLGMERRPQLSLGGFASHQNDVTSIPGGLAGAAVPLPPKDRWQAVLDVQQLLYDGGAINARAALERARLAESKSAVDAALYRLRGDVTAAFFTALLQQQRLRELDAIAVDLTARLEQARARVRNGVALGRDTSVIVAEQLRAHLSRREAETVRAAAVAQLASLTGRPTDTTAIMEMADLSAAVSRVRMDGVEAIRVRPEFAGYREARDRLEREAQVASLANRPRVVAFGQAGFGRPGFNQLRSEADELWQAGVHVEWRPFTWGSTDRSAEVIRMQQQVLDTEERAFAAALERSVEVDLAAVERLRDALDTDARLVALREDIERQASAEYAEGVIPAAEYVAARTDVLEARLALHRHRAELYQSQARFLTTLGLSPRTNQEGRP
ncbi:MAG: TolC family protein [Gemmatimonadaceae bacterium]